MRSCKENQIKYFVFENGSVGYLGEICTCERCEERGAAEYIINDKNKRYMNGAKISQIPYDVIYFGDNIEEGIKTLLRQMERKLEGKDEEILIRDNLLKEYEKKLIGLKLTV